MTRLITVLTLLIGLTFCAIIVWSSHQLVVLNNAHIYAENSVLENIQAFLLVLNCLAFLGLIKYQAKQPPLGHEPLALWFLAYLNFAFFLREVDPERMDIPWALQAAGSGIGRNVMLSVMLVGLAVPGLKRRKHYTQAAKSFLMSQAGYIVIFSGICLVAASIFDSAYGVPHYPFYEEVLEYLGYLALWFSAAICWVTRPQAG